jgi:hypothetical protein
MYQDLVEMAIREFVMNNRYHERPAILIMRYVTFDALVIELFGQNKQVLVGPEYLKNPRYKEQIIIRTIGDVGENEVRAY